MKPKHISAVALVAGAYLLSSCEETGRYQMVVTPPEEGLEGGHYWLPSCHVLDTKTGEVWIRYADGPTMARWDPVNKTLRFDSLTVTYLK